MTSFAFAQAASPASSVAGVPLTLSNVYSAAKALDAKNIVLAKTTDSPAVESLCEKSFMKTPFCSVISSITSFYFVNINALLIFFNISIIGDWIP